MQTAEMKRKKKGPCFRGMLRNNRSVSGTTQRSEWCQRRRAKQFSRKLCSSRRVVKTYKKENDSCCAATPIIRLDLQLIQLHN